MGRQLRFDPPGGIHHVMHRGSRRQLIFEEEADRRAFLARLASVQQQCGLVIHAFALMPNHYHLLVECPDAGLSLAMKKLNSVYAQWFNWRHAYDGHLFRGRFRSLLIGDDSYLVEVARYIHRNSVKAGLVEHPALDPWCSHQYYSRLRSPRWLCTDRVLDYFAGDRAQFDEFVSAPSSERARAVIEAIDSRRPAVGSAEFLESLRDGAPTDTAFAASLRRLEPIQAQAIEAAVRSALSAQPLSESPPNVDDVCLWVGRRMGFPVDLLRRHFEVTTNEAVRVRVHRLEQRAKSDARLRAHLQTAIDAADRAKRAA